MPRIDNKEHRDMRRRGKHESSQTNAKEGAEEIQARKTRKISTNLRGGVSTLLGWGSQTGMTGMAGSFKADLSGISGIPIFRSAL